MHVWLAVFPTKFLSRPLQPTQMLQAGIPAVIAMQLEISIDTALHFTQFLYEELITGSFPGSIDAAVGFARSNLYALDPNGSGYIAPVLWLNTNDDRIFNFPVQARVETQKYGQENLLTSNVKHSQISLSRSNFTSSKPNRSQFVQYRNTQRSFNRQWIARQNANLFTPLIPNIEMQQKTTLMLVKPALTLL